MKSSRGFISLGLILLLVISLAVLGGAGYYATKQSAAPQQAKDEAATSTATVTTQASTSAQITAELSPFILANGKASRYLVDATGGIHFDNGYHNDTICGHPDISTFQVLADLEGNPTGYAKDKKALYFRGDLFGLPIFPRPYHCPGYTPLADVDLPTFSVITDFNLNEDEPALSYSKDKSRVYYLSCEQFCGVLVIPNADPQTFEPLGPEHYTYAKDATHVWWDGGNEIISGADPATFSVIYPSKFTTNGEEYQAEDKNHKYYTNGVVQ